MNIQESYDKGFRDALEAYAWMKDGVSYLGSGITTLKEANKKIPNLHYYNPPCLDEKTSTEGHTPRDSG